MLVPWAVFHLEVTCQLWASLLGCQPWLCLSLAVWPGQYLGALLCPLEKTGQTPGLPQGVPVGSQGVNTSSYSSDRAWHGVGITLTTLGFPSTCWVSGKDTGLGSVTPGCSPACWGQVPSLLSP